MPPPSKTRNDYTGPPLLCGNRHLAPLLLLLLFVIVLFLFYNGLLFRRLEERVGQRDVVDAVHRRVVEHLRVQEEEDGHVDLFPRAESLLLEAEALDLVEVDTCERCRSGSGRGVRVFLCRDALYIVVRPLEGSAFLLKRGDLQGLRRPRPGSTRASICLSLVVRLSSSLRSIPRKNTRAMGMLDTGSNQALRVPARCICENESTCPRVCFCAPDVYEKKACFIAAPGTLALLACLQRENVVRGDAGDVLFRQVLGREER